MEDMMFATQDQLDEYNAEQADALNVETQKILLFQCDDLRLGVDAGSVVELLTNQIITYLPMMPDFIRGIINMRGQMVPILDIRLRLGKPPIDDSIVVVLDIDSAYIGILVDSMDQMIDIPINSILPVPAQSAQELVCGMCTLPDNSGTMMILDRAQLVAYV